ncbi:MAG: hypothetical protein RIS94_3675 [Pseudomonadota bacterium]|jgi:lipoprotein-anchoring transpeptidase ErfK/SrfK
MYRSLLSASLLALLAACHATGSGETAAPAASETSAAPASLADAMASHDPAPGQPPSPDETDDQPRPLMHLQVVLERLGFAPGVIDNTLGLSTRNALRGYQEAKGLPPSGAADDATMASLAPYAMIAATRLVTIPATFAAGPFAPLPKNPSDQAKLPALGYASLDEKLAERFHTTPEALHALNPAVQAFTAGQKIRVPNVGADAIDPTLVTDKNWAATLAALGVGTGSPAATRIVVSRSAGTLRAFDEQGKLVALFTVTTGSEHDPLPLGTWKILGIDHNPKFHYNPALFWDVSDAKPQALLPAGPNNPVGVVWIDLSKPHYGIHGTPEPQTIGRTESHGCVRLTNWDAARLSTMVSTSTQVEFVA